MRQDKIAVLNPNAHNTHQLYNICTTRNILSPGVGVTKPIFSVPLFSKNFQNDQNSDCLYGIMFIFERCNRSWAAGTPGKYEHDWKYRTYSFAESKFPATEKLTNGVLVTPAPGYVYMRQWTEPAML